MQKKDASGSVLAWVLVGIPVLIVIIAAIKYL